MKEEIECYYCLGTLFDGNEKVCEPCYDRYLNKIITGLKNNYRTQIEKKEE